MPRKEMMMEIKKSVTIHRTSGRFVVEYHGKCINTYASIMIALRHLRIYFEEPESLGMFTPANQDRSKEPGWKDELLDDAGLKELSDPLD